MRNAALAVLALGAAIVNSAATADEFLDRFMGAPIGKAKAFACFARDYDAEHLAAHPLQNVKSMRLLVIVDPNAPGDISLRIRASFRTRKGALDTEGNCGLPDGGESSPEGLRCGVDCDGGKMELNLKSSGSVLLSVPDGARLWVPGSDNPDGNVHGAFGPDDKLFRLDRTAAIDCLPLAEAPDEKAAIKRLK